jgi:hypothetical protein
VADSWLSLIIGGELRALQTTPFDGSLSMPDRSSVQPAILWNKNRFAFTRGWFEWSTNREEHAAVARAQFDAIEYHSVVEMNGPSEARINFIDRVTEWTAAPATTLPNRAI